MEGAGFGDGCNRGFETLRGLGWSGWVWLLNPDIRLASGDELLDLLQALATLPANAVVGTVVCDGEGGVEPSGGWLSDGLRFRGVTLQAQHQQALAPVAVDWLSGCSLALQPEAHRPPARFDPAFPLYYEDMDLCRRLAGQGAPLLWLPGIRVGHRRGSGSSTPEPRRLRLSTLGYLRYLRRHTPGWVMALRSARLLLLSLLRLPWRPRRSLAVLAAMLEVLQDPEGCRG
jgi:GT2 family glycosyltransferase